MECNSIVLTKPFGRNDVYSIRYRQARFALIEATLHDNQLIEQQTSKNSLHRCSMKAHRPRKRAPLKRQTIDTKTGLTIAETLIFAEAIIDTLKVKRSGTLTAPVRITLCPRYNRVRRASVPLE
jgi:hypothetical protein